MKHWNKNEELNEQMNHNTGNSSLLHSFNVQHRPKKFYFVPNSYIVRASSIHSLLPFIRCICHFVHGYLYYLLSFLLPYFFIHSSFQTSLLHLLHHFILFFIHTACHCWWQLGNGTISLGREEGFHLFCRIESFN